MKRKIALLLVFCMLTTMLPAALADEIVQIEDGEVAVVELSDDAIEVVEDAPLDLDLELEDLELGQLDLEDLEQPSVEAEDVPAADAPEADPEDEETEEGNASTAGVPAKLTLGVKQTFTLDPSGIAKGKTVTYKSSKTSVATVSKKGVITAKKTGTAKITLTASKKTIATCTVTVVSAPKQMTLPADSIEITVKETYQIKPKLPSKTMASFTYTSKDKKIATVSKDGLVTGVKLGTTEITVKTHNKLTATLKVTVKATEPTAPGSVKLDMTKATLSAGDTLQLTATLPKDTASALTWTSDNASVATVNDYGLVTAVGSGTAKITVKTANDKKATCTVTVKKAPGKVTIKPTKVSLGKGESVQLTATLPKGTTSDLTWKSSKSSVAKVSETGLVTAVKVGTAKITVSTYNGKKATCTVTVKKSGSSDAKAPSKVSLDVSKATLSAGDTLQLTAKLPAGTVSSLSWSSSDTAVAKVKSTGLVTAVKAGTAKITVETANNKKATCTVTVKKAPESVTLNAHELIIGVDEIFQLRPTLTKGTTSELTWKSSKSSVATVSENGLITAKQEGTAKITVETYNGKKDTCNVTVEKAALLRAYTDQATFDIAPQATATLSVKVECRRDPELTYTWYQGDAAIADATGASYIVTPDKVGSYAYRCVVSDGSSAQEVGFTVNVGNTFSAKADSATEQTIYVGQTATLSVSATCAVGQPTYQWYKGDAAISGATGATYTTEALSASTAYKCVVADGFGSATVTLDFTVSVKERTLTSATAATASFNLKPGEKATLQVNTAGDGNPTLTYKWYQGSAEITGATGASYTVTAGNVGSYAYSCVVTDDSTSKNSATVNFTVNVNNSLDAKAGSATAQTVFTGKAATLSVTASCATGSVSYQWYEGDEAISGATGSSYSATKDAVGSYAYKCVVSDSYGSETATLNFTVTVKEPSLTGATAEAASVTVAPEKTATLKVNATCDGEPGLTYVWYAGDEEIAGATEASYTVTAGNVGSYAYSCVVTDDSTSKNSATVSFTVNVNNSLDAKADSATEQTVFIGEAATLSVAASCATGDVAYQWYEGDEAISGATGASYSATKDAVGSYAYKCVVADSYGSETATLSFTVTVKAPSLTGATAEAGSVTIAPTNTATLKVNVTCDGAPELTYAWYAGDEEIAGATEDSYVVTAGNVGSYAYSCVVTDGTNTEEVTFEVNVDNDLEVVAVSETEQTVSIGQAATLDVEATCAEGAVTIRWFEGDEEIAGADGDSYSVTKDEAGTYAYRCVVEDAYGSESQAVGFTVTVVDAVSGVRINETNFPDSIFRSLVEKYDFNGDGALSDDEISEIDYLWFDEGEMTSIQGVEYLTALELLSCSQNHGLTAVDLSANTQLRTLYINDCGLTELDLSHNTNLQTLYCQGNPLTELDLTNCSSMLKRISWGSYSEEDGVLDFAGYLRVDSNVTIIGLPEPEKPDAEPLNLGQSATAAIGEAGAIAYFSFTPEETGKYRFYSTGDEDTFGHLYNSDMREIASDDDGGDGTNFRITETLEAGNEYILGARFLEEEATGSFEVCVERLVGLISASSEYESNVAAGSEFTLRVVTETTDDEPLDYQWYMDGELIDGENGAEYIGIARAQYTQYYCRVSDDYGNSQDVWFYVIVEDWVDNELQVSAESEEITVTPGDSATLEARATAVDMTDMTCQWFYQSKSLDEHGRWDEYDWIALGDPTDMTVEEDCASATWTLDADEVRTTRYRCEVTDKNGATASAEFNVQVERNLYADWDRENSVFTAPFGETATLVFRMVDGENWETATVEDLSYSWYKHNGDEFDRIDGQTGASYTIPSLTESGEYMCVAVDSYWNLFDARGTAEVENHLTVTIPKSEPNYVELWEGDVMVIIPSGTSPTLMADASCDTDQMTFQWCEDFGGSEIAGATGTSYITPELYENRDYSCIVTDNYGTEAMACFRVRVVDYDAVQALELGVPQSVSFDDAYTVQMYSFTPETTGEYAFRSSDIPEGYFILGRLYNGSMDSVGRLVESPDRNFRIIATLTGGERYYFAAIDPGYGTSCVLRVEEYEVDGIVIDETNFPDPIFRSLVSGRDDDGDGALSDDEISNITSLWYDEGELTSIQGVEYLTALEVLNCSQNRGLTAVDLSANTQLRTLYINDCGLTGLDLSNHENLETVYCQGNQLTELDITNCGGLLERVSWDDCYDDEGFLNFGGALKVDSDVTIIGLPEPEKPDAEPLTLGQAATATIGEAEEIAYFSFTPEEAGAYEFYSTGKGDPRGKLYTSVMREIEYDDDSGDGYNFRISAKLDAGKEYFLAAYFAGDSTGSFTVCVEKLVGLISASSEYEGNVAAGSKVALRVVTETTDDEPLDYQWFRGDGDGAEQISGETASTYTLTATRNEQYRCEVRDAHGHVENVSFWITIENGLEANAVGETDVTANMGQPVTLAVTASCDEGEPSYQWYRSGESIDGENGAEYTGIAPAQYTDYYCRVSDDYGNSRDVWFYVTVEDWVDNELQVSAESEEITVTPGDSATLEARATATDMSEMTCQWFYQSKNLNEHGNWDEGDWIALGDPTAMTAEEDCAPATWTLDADEVRTTRYRCEVTDKYGATASAEFNVRVERNLYADWDGENSVPTVPLGETATLVFRMVDGENWETVTVEDLSYSWYKYNGDEFDRIDGQTGMSYTIPSLTETGDYMCVAVDGYWNLFERKERVTVENHLTVTIPKSEPSYVELWEGNVTVIIPSGTSATLMVNASCDTDQMTFQWYNGFEGSKITGETGISYTTSALYEDCEYSCIVTDNYGTPKTACFRVRAVDLGAAQALEFGVPQSVTFDDAYTVQMYRFTPETTGEYAFRSSDIPEGEFILGRLYDGNMNPIGTLEENPYNYFRIVATLTGGERYYLAAIDPGYGIYCNITVE